MKLRIINRNTNTHIYFQLCEENYKDYVEKYVELMNKGNFYKNRPVILRGLESIHSSGSYKMSERYRATSSYQQLEATVQLFNIIEKKRVSAIIFALCCLENFIFDYAATYMGDKEAEEDMDTPNFMFKWLTIIRYVTGKRFPKETQPYQHLKALIKERNNLIHYKSESIERFFDFVKNMAKNKKILIEQEKQITEQINPLETIKEVLQEVKNLEADISQEDKKKLLKWELEENTKT